VAPDVEEAAAMPVAPVVPSEGWGVLHLFFHLRREALEDAASAAKDFSARLRAFDARDGQQVLAFSVLGQKADFGLMALAEDLVELDALSTELATSPLGAALLPAGSYLSMTELSEYTSTLDDESARLAAAGIDPSSAEHATALAEFGRRMEEYAEHRLHPRLPSKRVISFYPMSKRREGGDNWYRLDFAERKRLMGGHARVGRTFAGRILQLITGSVGLDDWEWGVTLLADDPKAIRDIVYEMRFDEVSARYGEFGPFVTGLVLDPDDLLRHLGLPA
jgi:hydrogen peroxide-dependent heme synthase